MIDLKLIEILTYFLDPTIREEIFKSIIFIAKDAVFESETKELKEEDLVVIKFDNRWLKFFGNSNCENIFLLDDIFKLQNPEKIVDNLKLCKTKKISSGDEIVGLIIKQWSGFMESKSNHDFIQYYAVAILSDENIYIFFDWNERNGLTIEKIEQKKTVFERIKNEYNRIRKTILGIDPIKK